MINAMPTQFRNFIPPSLPLFVTRDNDWCIQYAFALVELHAQFIYTLRPYRQWRETFGIRVNIGAPSVKITMTDMKSNILRKIR
jgi:hypothetical protein